MMPHLAENLFRKLAGEIEAAQLPSFMFYPIEAKIAFHPQCYTLEVKMSGEILTIIYKTTPPYAPPCSVEMDVDLTGIIQDKELLEKMLSEDIAKMIFRISKLLVKESSNPKP